MNYKAIIDQLNKLEASEMAFREQICKTRRLIEKEAGVSTPAKGQRKKHAGDLYAERLMRRIQKRQAMAGKA